MERGQRKTLSPGILSHRCISLDDMLVVSNDLLERRRTQEKCITQIRYLVSLPPLQHFQPVLSITPTKWDDKRRLGHIQRCVYAEDADLHFERFGLTMLEWLTKQDANPSEIDRRSRNIFLGEGYDTTTAWSVAPFLMAEGASLHNICAWVAEAETEGNRKSPQDIFLPGLELLPEPLSFPDRSSYVQNRKGAKVHEPTLSEHPHYPIAHEIARFLIEQGFVLQQ